MKTSLDNQNALFDSPLYLLENNKMPPEITGQNEIKTYSENDPIELLGLPRRIEHALDMHANIVTVGEFYRYPENQFYKLRNLGPKYIDYLLKIKGTIQISGYNPESITHEIESPNPVNKLQINQNHSDYNSSIPAPFNYLSLNDMYLPPNLNENDRIEVLSLPVRLENSLRFGGDIITIGQLCDVTDKDLLRMRNIGKKSVNYLMGIRKKIRDKFGVLAISNSDEEPNEVKAEEINIPDNQLVTFLLERCGEDRAKEVIVRRYGLTTGERQTLEEIGEFYGVTRERIRQIQAKAIRKMQHHTPARKPLIDLIEEVLYKNGGLISAEEADRQIPELLGGAVEDGSSMLDLLCDLSWIQSYWIGDVAIYSPRLDGITLYKLSVEIISLVKSAEIGIDADSISKNVELFKKIKDGRFNANNFINRYCDLDPRIEKLELASDPPRIVFIHYSASGHLATKDWLALISRVLEQEQMPLHYTEIANKINDLLGNQRKLDARRAHSLLIEGKTFAHSGINGTYGLVSWGLRKESTPELIEECMKKAGFPLHWKQIYNYVSKYKNSKPGSIFSILEFNKKFKKVNSGVYWLSDDNEVI